MKRILIVEDEQDIQELLEAYLGDAGYETATAGDGIEAVSLFQQEAFDLVLLDVMLPKLDGFGVCELIRRQSRVPIVLLTALDGEAEQLRGFDLEIDDYITKPFSMPILLRKLAAVLRRAGGDAPGRCLRYRGLTLDPDAVEVRLDGRVLEQLTAREFELLRELLSSPGRVFTREILLAKLWGYDFFGDERVVDSHIKNLRKKLGVDYIETVRGWATVCRRNIRESLTARIFLLTLLLLLGAGGLTFGLIAWATPITYVSVVGDRLQVQVNELTDRLALTKLADAGPILDVFVRESGAAVPLASPDGESVDTGSLYVSVTTAVQESDSVSTYTYGADGGPAQRERAGHYVTTALSDALIAEVTFADRAETYQLLVVPPMRLANQAVEALNRAAPCLALALLAFSLLCAVGYSRYLARPIVRISSIAGRMAELDFQWKCGETRRDEIGALGRSLDEMAERLSAALAELEEANAALRGDMERARELERQRLAFFSAASHELKTPVTILKGQLSGMLDGVGVYRDREKYLARSLQVAGRMEALVGELLAVSRMESDGASRREAVELSALTAEKLAQDAELLEQRGMTVLEALEPGLLVEGERALLGRAVENLLSNAALYSPEGAEIRVTAAGRGAQVVLTVENTGARIPAEALPHLFEAFYRAEPSRSRATGGSGLGLYLVRMIVERHGGTCRIENSADGVRFTALIPRLSTENT